MATEASLEALMILCRADVTTKNPNKAKRFLANFDKVEEKMLEVEASDRLRNFQPLLTGELIMQVFALPPCKEIGLIKEQIRESILEGKIKNTMAECLFMAIQIAGELAIKPAADFDGEQFLAEVQA